MRNGLTATITRMGLEPQTAHLDEGATLEEVLESVGITDLSDNETVWVAGEKAGLDSIIDDGDQIQIVGKKEGGVK